MPVLLAGFICVVVNFFFFGFQELFYGLSSCPLATRTGYEERTPVLSRFSFRTPDLK